MNPIKKEIETKYGTYFYFEKHFQNGIKKLDRVVARENLLLFKKCLDQRGVKFGLIYGTLLGAIREGNFIAHDEDTDVYILSENIGLVVDILFVLRELGFEVGRYTEKLISFVRNDEYIDVYFFRKSRRGLRDSEGYVIKAETLEKPEKLMFLGEEFDVPKNPQELLVHLYGKNWRVPIENKPASNYGLYLTIKLFIKNNFKFLFKIISKLKNALNV